MQEQCPVKEKVWDIVEQVSCQQDLAHCAVLLELFVGDVVALAPPSQQVEDEQAGVEQGAQCPRVPDYNVTQQVDLK